MDLSRAEGYVERIAFIDAEIERLKDLNKERAAAVVVLEAQLKVAKDNYALYTKFNKAAAGATVSKNEIKTGSMAWKGRTDAEAKRAQKQINLENKLVDIIKAKNDMKILEKVLGETSELEDTDPAKINAQLAVNTQQSVVDLLGEEEAHLRRLINPLEQIKLAATNAFGQGLQSAIMGIIDGTKSMKEGFLDMAKAVLVAIAQIIAQMIAMKALQAVGLSIPMASGGVIGGSKPKGYRSGGVVTEPTYLVGEGKYNEAVVPLPDGRSIPVMMKGGSGGNANVTVNISADGQTTDNISSDNGEQGAQLGRAISAAVQEEMHKQQRPGGILSPYGG